MYFNIPLIFNVFKVWDLETDGTYQFRVKAQSKFGISDACESEEVVTKDPFRLPGPPEKPQVAQYTKSSMLVTWEPPLDSGGSPVTGYWLEKKEKRGAYWARVNRAPISKRGLKGWEFSVPRLIEGIEYQFRVMACNAGGTGPPSEPSDPALAVDPLCK